ncbi:MAG: cobalt-precorrin-5B (C(1))-methyltransferase [Alphaproteobacteria bacterium]|nr:cobalt-precorrin-5B (C(1))-methyltransferase [Alphaproteobacteria bacterium]
MAGTLHRRARGGYHPAMNDTGAESRRPAGELKRGWTTGACATAAARAAYEALVTGRFPDPVTIRLPQGQRPSFALARGTLAGGAATAGVVKDAGDDPDVTHGATVLATLRWGTPGDGITFRAGDGVGTVTRPGLPLAVGEPAINPGPRAMMRAAVADAAEALGGPEDVEITVSIPGGQALAERTMNARLGIVGGLSILGTTGVVIPYSCASWIHAIHRGVDVARAAGIQHLIGATGSTSERAAQAMFRAPEQALIDMGDFVGGLLKYLRKHPVPRLTIAGGFAKLAKLAQGHLDLHSSRSRVDLGELAGRVARLGGDAALVERVRHAAGAGEVLAIARDLDLPDAVARGAREVVLAALGGGIAVDVLAFDREGTLIGHAGP